MDVMNRLETMLTKEQLDHLEARLLQERQKVTRKLARFDDDFAKSPTASDGDLSAFSLHMADEGTDAMEREKAFLFASEEGRRLKQINAALRRLYRSPATFGQCAACRGEIGYYRLDAIPHVDRCINCQNEHEMGS
jgi:RNA polymerase-binding transcription factor DksA